MVNLNVLVAIFENFYSRFTILVTTNIVNGAKDKTDNVRIYFRTNKITIQWNLSKADSCGTEVFVRFGEVSALERFQLKSSQI